MIYGGWNNFFIKINIQAFSTCFLTKNFFYKTRGDYFRFGSIFIKKNNQIKFFFLKPKPVQTDRFRFGLVF